MKKYAIFTLLIFLISGAFWLRESLALKQDIKVLSGAPERIVSLSPGITETLYALGLGDKIVGVTQFCKWPPEAAQKPKVAGFREVNLEAIARVKPDLVVLPHDMAHVGAQIKTLGIPVLTFEGLSLKGFLRDLEKLGQVCAVEEKSGQLYSAFQKALAQAPSQESDSRPTVLFAILNPDDCSRPITELNVIGNDGFYNELIEAAGGKNAYQGTVPFPRLSREAILAINPDIIIAAAPDWTDESGLAANWQKLGKLKAIENRHLRIFTDPGDTIPGPRSLHTLDELARVVGQAMEGERKK